MKHIFIADEHISSKQNGIGTYMHNLAECMEGPDTDVNFLSFNSEEKFFTIYKEKNYRYYCFPFCNGGRFTEIGGLFWPILRMHVEDSKDNVFFVNHSPCVEFLKSLHEYYRKSRIIFTIHDQGWTASLMGDKKKLNKVVSSGFRKSEKYKLENHCKKSFEKEKKMYRIANDVICLSETTTKLLVNTYKVPETKVHLIPNGIPPVTEICTSEERNKLRRETGIEDDEKILLFVGRTVKAKGIDELLQAFEKLYVQHKKIRLVIAGEVFRLNEFVRLTPQSVTRITYTGLIPRERLQKWYKMADIGILPSYTEQCSYTGLEMMANGLLTIATNGNGLTDMFIPGYNALVAPIDEHFADNLEETINKALHLTTEERLNICNSALEFVQSRHSLHIMKEGYRRLLKRQISDQ